MTDQGIALEQSIVGIGGSAVPWYRIKYRVLRKGEVLLDLGLADWADWDQHGDLLFAKNGCLFRQRIARAPNSAARLLADFQRFEVRECSRPCFRTALVKSFRFTDTVLLPMN